MITHYDLFAGIGGFSLALEEVFQDDSIRHIFCEWEKFPTAVLRQHWPEAEFYGDIADLVADTQHQRQAHRKHEEQPRHKETLPERGNNFSIVTGGFPCQPFSAAGRRKGTADDRYQWPNMFEVIRNTSPDWVIAENVRGLVTWNEGLVLETVCADLESEGYEVQPFIIPAVAVGAPHRRDRVWIIGHNADTRCRNEQPGSKTIRQERQESLNENSQRNSWQRNWQEVAFATCDDSVDDGLSRIVDGVSYSRAKWRKDSLKAYGNGIVHQVATQIIRSIKETL